MDEARQHTTPPAPRTLTDAFRRTAGRRPDAPALANLDGTVDLTWADYAERVGAIAAGLRSLGAEGRTVALLCGNRPEWQLVDLAALFAGANPFSLYPTATAEQINELLRDANAHVLIADNTLLEKVTEAPIAAHLVALDDHADLMTLAQLEQLATPLDVLTYPDPAAESDTATIIYTSGTTGEPKGVELSHANILFVAEALQGVLDMTDGRLVSYLPHAHVVDRLVGHYLPIVTGSSVTTVPTPSAVFDALPRIRPTIFTSVPRLWEGLRHKLEERIRSDRELTAALQRGLDRVRSSAGETSTDSIHAEDESRYWRPLRTGLGFGDTNWMITGSAPLPIGSHEFFQAINLPLCDMWGLSETVALATIMPPGQQRIGTVGRALPGTELRLDTDGEILLRGPHVTRGYRGNPAATAAAFTEGWFHTGDIGTLDDDGWLFLVGRKKELIVTAGGENIAPNWLEGLLVDASPLINQACCIGDGKPFVTALLVLDPDQPNTPETRAAVGVAVDAVNASLGRHEQIRRYVVLDHAFTVNNGQLTPTLKLRRTAVEAAQSRTIAAMYADASPHNPTSSAVIPNAQLQG